MTKLNIAVSGSSGLIGQALVEALTEKGHTIHPIVRGPDVRRKNYIVWLPSGVDFDASQLEGIDAVVHLAGEPIGEGRWSSQTKIRIRASRVDGTKSLASAIPKLNKPPRVFLCASAIGYYGVDGQDQLMDESGAQGDGFLADVCGEWEAASQAAATETTRLVNLRFGVVLAKDGGALKKMLLPFKMGVGGVIGSGKQWMSWISLKDVVRAIEYSIENEALRGPINVVSPEPITNKEFTKALGDVLRRPTLFPVPKFGMKAMFGEMGEQTVLSNQRILPQQLIDSGFSFDFPDIKSALTDILD